MEKNPNQPTELGDQELRSVFNGVIERWRRGELTYEEAIGIYTATALKKSIDKLKNDA